MAIGTVTYGVRKVNNVTSADWVQSVVKVRSHFATDLSVAAVSAASADGTANENCGAIFPVS